MTALGTRPARGYYLLLGGAVLLLDQLSKWVVGQALPAGETRRILPGLFNLTHVRNRGAAFGLLGDLAPSVVLILLVGLSVATLVLVLSLLWRGPGSRLAGWGLGLILGGALGNLIDRVRAGSVVDFFDFYLGSYHWPAFNLADSAIVLGAAALAGHVLRSRSGGSGEA